jgi:hypothetical protein
VRRRALRSVVAVALALALAAASAGARGPSDQGRLRALELRYHAHLLADRPDLASRIGLTHADDRLEPVTEATLARDATLLDALRDSLTAVERGTPPASERAVLDSLRARIEREAAPLREGRWRGDPLLYVELTHRAVMDAARRPHVSPCERTRRAIARLRAIPEVLRSGEVNLRDAKAFDREAVDAGWAEAMTDLRVAIPAVGTDCHDADRFADLVEADSLALGAVRRFVLFLRGQARPGGPAPGAH